MEISVINLDRSPDRLSDFMENNRHLSSVKRFPAFEGRGISRQSLKERNILEGDMLTYSDGAIGCALSHLVQWEKCINEKKVLTIAEDDAVFHREFECLAQEVLASLPIDWDIILWGWNFDSIVAFDMLPGVSYCIGSFDQDGLRKNIQGYQHAIVAPKAYRAIRCVGTVCYTISPSGAEKLYKYCLPIRTMDVLYPGLNQNRPLPNTGIDNMMNELYPRINAFVSFPPLVATKNDHSISTIR
jgi:glycosyl transferase, family 25